jgi:hypothetical protein
VKNAKQWNFDCLGLLQEDFFPRGMMMGWILILENKSSTIRKLKKNHKRKRSTEEERS